MYKTFTQMNELLRTAAQISPKNCGGKKMEDIAAGRCSAEKAAALLCAEFNDRLKLLKEEIS